MLTRYVYPAVLAVSLLGMAACGNDADSRADGGDHSQAIDAPDDDRRDRPAETAAGPASSPLRAFTRPSLEARRIGGDSPVVRRDRPGPKDAKSPFSPDKLSSRDHVIAPWTRVVADSVARNVEVSDEAITVPADVASEFDSLQRHDVLVSGASDAPFSRRVLEIRPHDDGRLTLRTADATLAESILKGSISSAESPSDGGPPSSTEDDPYRRRSQALRNGDVDYKSLGSFDAQGLGLSVISSLVPPVGVFTDLGATFNIDISGRPTASLEPKYWFNLDIDFDAGDKTPKGSFFFSTRTCERDSDCFDGGLAGGEKCKPYFPSVHNVHPEIEQYLTVHTQQNQVRYCTYNPGPEDGQVEVREPAGSDHKDEYRTCKRLLETLEWVKEDGDGHQCGKDWQTWYDSRGRRGPRNPKSCQGWFWDAFAPYPAQLEWAKLACHGTVKQFELDFKTDLSAGIEDFEMTASGTGFKAWAPINMDPKTLATPMFWVGWVPVVLTFNFDFSMPIVASLTGDVSFNASDPGYMGVREASIDGGGLHMYGSESAYQKGHFGPPADQRPDGYLNALHVNEADAPEAQIEIPEAGGNLKGGVAISLNPELNLLLYDMAGPYVRPFTPYAEFFGAVGSDKRCNLGARSGARGRIGVKAQLPFGLSGGGADSSSSGQTAGPDRTKARNLLGYNPNFSWTLYNTCAADQSFVESAFFEEQPDADPTAMCREGLEQFCWRTCLMGDCDEEPDDDPPAGGEDTGPDTGADTGPGPDTSRPDTSAPHTAPDTGVEADSSRLLIPASDAQSKSGGCSSTGSEGPAWPSWLFVGLIVAAARTRRERK